MAVTFLKTKMAPMSTVHRSPPSNRAEVLPQQRQGATSETAGAGAGVVRGLLQHQHWRTLPLPPRLLRSQRRRRRQRRRRHRRQLLLLLFLLQGRLVPLVLPTVNVASWNERVPWMLLFNHGTTDRTDRVTRIIKNPDKSSKAVTFYRISVAGIYNKMKGGVDNNDHLAYHAMALTKLGTKLWWMRVGMYLLLMAGVNAFAFFKYSVLLGRARLPPSMSDIKDHRRFRGLLVQSLLDARAAAADDGVLRDMLGDPAADCGRAEPVPAHDVDARQLDAHDLKENALQGDSPRRAQRRCAVPDCPLHGAAKKTTWTCKCGCPVHTSCFMRHVKFSLGAEIPSAAPQQEAAAAAAAAARRAHDNEAMEYDEYNTESDE
jgi:hypothetical protein